MVFWFVCAKSHVECLRHIPPIVATFCRVPVKEEAALGVLVASGWVQRAKKDGLKKITLCWNVHMNVPRKSSLQVFACLFGCWLDGPLILDKPIAGPSCRACVCVCVCEPPCPPRAASVPFTADECTEFKHSMQGKICISMTWHAIRNHVQRSYLIVWEAKADHLCVPARICVNC